MAKENSDDTDGWESLLWGVLGFVAGAVLATTYVRSAGYASDEVLPTDMGIIMVVLFFAPVLVFWAIGEQLRKEVLRGKITAATYWTTFFGIAVAVFTLLGLSGVDDLLALWDD